MSNMLSGMSEFLSSGKETSKGTGDGATRKDFVDRIKVIDGDSLEEITAKTLDLARELGLSSAEVSGLEEKLSKISASIAETEGAKASGRKFGCYNHAALSGITSAAEASLKLDSALAKVKADPEATITLKLAEALELLATFKRGYAAARSSGSQELTRVAETGTALALWACGIAKNTPSETFKRLCTMWTGAGPGEIDFRPVFDEDYIAISAAWLEYKEGRIDGNEFRKRCDAVRPSSHMACDCENCKAYSV